MTAELHIFETLSGAIPVKGGLMSKLGNYDSLTGLLCRSAFEVDKTSKNFDAKIAAVFMVNFDQFAKVNRDHGRAIGDFVLAMQADRLTGQASDYQHATYRYEGDRFIQVLMSDQPLDDQELKRIACTIKQELARDIRLSDRSISVSCTLTAATKPKDVPLNRIVTEAMLLAAELKYQGPDQLHLLCQETLTKLKVS